MKNVLHIMDFAAPYGGNFILSIECLEKHWAQSGTSTYLFPDVARGCSWVLDLIARGKRVYFIDRSFFSKKVKWNNLQQLQTILKTEDIHIIHTHFVACNYTLFLLKKVFARNVYIIGHFHSQYFFSSKNWVKKIKVQITNSSFDLIIGVSKSVADGVIQNGINKTKVCYVPNGINFNRLDTFDEIKFTEDESKVILMFGRPYHTKGVDVAIEAVSKLICDGKDVKLVVSYTGSLDEIRAEILADFKTIPSWLILVSPRNDVATYYNAADIFLSASREEGFSYSLVEAAYCKPMLVSSNIPAPVALNIPAVALFESENAMQLSEVLNNMINIKSVEKLRLKDLQQHYVASQFDLDSWASNVIAYYKFR